MTSRAQIAHAEGEVTRTATGSYQTEFVLRDHLGNTRITFCDVNNDGLVNDSEILQSNNYYPFGLNMEMNTNGANGNNKYQYNGKELNQEFGLNWNDYGFRDYDATIGRWHVRDEYAELLETASPYVYVLNSPAIYVDKDGNLPIYINGRNDDHSQPGLVAYWSDLESTIANSGIPNPGGESHYIDGDRYISQNNRVNVEHVENGTYLTGHSASSRVEAGRRVGSEDFENVIKKLARDPKTGKIIEKIQIYTHSRGGAFGAGYTEGLLKMIKAHASEFVDPNNVIDFVLNLAPHQTGFFGFSNYKSPKGVPSYSIHNAGDILSGNQIGGLNVPFNSSGNKGSGFLQSHSILSFKNDLQEFLKEFQKSNGSSFMLMINFNHYLKEKEDIDKIYFYHDPICIGCDGPAH